MGKDGDMEGGREGRRDGRTLPSGRRRPSLTRAWQARPPARKDRLRKSKLRQFHIKHLEEARFLHLAVELRK